MSNKYITVAMLTFGLLSVVPQAHAGVLYDGHDIDPAKYKDAENWNYFFGSKKDKDTSSENKDKNKVMEDLKPEMQKQCEATADAQGFKEGTPVTCTFVVSNGKIVGVTTKVDTDRLAREKVGEDTSKELGFHNQKDLTNDEANALIKQIQEQNK